MSGSCDAGDGTWIEDDGASMEGDPGVSDGPEAGFTHVRVCNIVHVSPFLHPILLVGLQVHVKSSLSHG